jgi:hypothetical protein
VARVASHSICCRSTTFRSKFDRIVIFCPTFHENKAYEKKWVLTDPDVIVLPPIRVRYNLDSLLQMCSETYGGTGDNVLFLIDDCANQKDAK